MAATQLRAVRSAVETIQQATADRDQAMREARESGETWQDIAEAAGMTPHGVRKALGYKRVTPSLGDTSSA